MPFDIESFLPILDGPGIFDESVVGTDVRFTLPDGVILVRVERLGGLDPETDFQEFFGWYARNPGVRVHGGFNQKTSLGEIEYC